MYFESAAEATKKVKTFVAENCLRPFACLCRNVGNFKFAESKSVSMNHAGVLLEGSILNDTGYHMKQNFLDVNLVGCQCSPENRVVDVRVVVTNQQWETVLAHHDTHDLSEG